MDLLKMLSNLADGTIIGIIVILGIKIWYWCSLHGNLVDTKRYSENIDKNFAETGNKLIEQNETIIENQKKIIELLENKKNDLE